MELPCNILKIVVSDIDEGLYNRAGWSYTALPSRTTYCQRAQVQFGTVVAVANKVKDPLEQTVDPP